MVGPELQQTAQTFFCMDPGGLARCQGDNISRKRSKTWPLQAVGRALPRRGILSLDAEILKVSDHGGNRALDQGPPLGGFEQLFPGDLPQAEVLRRHGLGEEQLVRGAPVLQNYRQKRVAAVTFPKTKDYVNASELVAARRVGSLRANASHLFGAEAQALVPPDRS